MRNYLVIALSLLFSSGFAQEKAWVFFTDKPNVEQQFSQPEKYLSVRALERRANQNIALHPTDFPVEKSYVKVLKENGFQIARNSKWLNAVSVNISSQSEVDFLEGLDFVKRVSSVKTLKLAQVESFYKTTATAVSSLNYGNTKAQIEQLNGDFLHDNGYRGQGMLIAVLDGGFSDVDNMSGFDSLWMNQRILTSYDFVDNDTDVFHLGIHGRSVLSVMAGYVDNIYVGSAPNANYILLKSENESSESKVEEDNWVAAAEFADSVGADIINSSLGYNKFDGGVGDYVYADFDGRTTVVSQGAVWAHRKGMLVVNSMGNEGVSNWQYMLSPADTDSILSIGGADASDNYIGFASKGPTADGRQKPNVSALAVGVYVLTSSSSASPGNGTSFAAPLISGLAACLWQAEPTLTNYQVLELIERSAHQYNTPDNFLGFGIPNFALAYSNISLEEEELYDFSVTPNPVQNELFINIPVGFNDSNLRFELYSISGKRIEVKSERDLDLLKLIGLKDLPHGVYVLHLSANNKTKSFKLIH